MTQRVGRVALVGALGWLALPIAAQPIQNLVLRNSFNPIGAGARGLGMGGAFIAVADDGTAASFNPAGLAQLRRTEFVLVGFHGTLASETTFTDIRTGTTNTDSSTSRHGALDFAGLSIPFEVGGRKMTVQLSYQRAIDLFGEGAVRIQDFAPAVEVLETTTFPISLPRLPGLRITGVTPQTMLSLASIADQRSPISQSGAFHTGTASIAYQATQRLALGLSFNYWHAAWKASGVNRFEISVPQAFTNGQPLTLLSNVATFEQDHAMRGFSINSGFLLRYPKLSIGGTLRLPFAGDYDLDETVDEEIEMLSDLLTEEERRDLGVPLSAARAHFSVSTPTRFGSRLRWPRSGGIGIALRPFSGLTLAADYSLAKWSRAVIEDVPAGALFTPAMQDEDADLTYSDRSFFDLEAAAQTTTLDTSAWRVGGEYLVSLPWLVLPLRGGYYRDESPIGQLTGGAREIRAWTAGSGLNFNRVVLDVAFERRSSEGAVTLFLNRGTTVNNANAPVEQIRDDRIVASVMYRFGGDDDPIKRLFRSIFVGPKEQ